MVKAELFYLFFIFLNVFVCVCVCFFLFFFFCACDVCGGALLHPLLLFR